MLQRNELDVEREYLYQTAWRMYGGRCVRCASPADNIHHIIPRSKGGTDDAENLCPLCNACHTWAHNVGTDHASSILRLGQARMLGIIGG